RRAVVQPTCRFTMCVPTPEQEIWAVALWVERHHGNRRPVYIAEQIGRLALHGDDGHDDEEEDRGPLQRADAGAAAGPLVSDRRPNNREARGQWLTPKGENPPMHRIPAGRCSLESNPNEV